MNCWKCGQAVEDGWNYCRSCGQQLRDHPPIQKRGWKIPIIKMETEPKEQDETVSQDDCPETDESYFETPPFIKKFLEACQKKEYNLLVGWLMALVPIIGIPLQMLTGSGEVYLILNILLGYFDGYRLRKQGIQTAQFGRLAFLVPYYLYKRARILGDSMAYCIVWCVLMGITTLI